MSRIKIYTDGACSGNPGPGGWAAVIFLNAVRKKEISGFEPNATNNRMELTAVVKAIKYIALLEGEKGRKINIYSDSAYVVNAVKSSWIKKWECNGWKTVRGDDIKNKDLWLQLLELVKEHKVNMIKIKGHVGDFHNESADLLAKAEIEKRRHDVQRVN